MPKAYAVKLAPSAIEDLKEATEWYASRLSEGLAARFIKAVDTTLTQLADVPGRGSIRYENIRCTLVNKFPYLFIVK